MNQLYKCPYCQSIFPLFNKTIHEANCPFFNLSQYNKMQNSNINNKINNDFNQNINSNSNQLVVRNMDKNMNNNIISSNVSSNTNPDGTVSEIKIEIFQNGNQRITKTKYDQFHKVIDRQVNEQNINNNTNNNGVNNNINVQRETDSFGNIIETKTEIFPNGGLRIAKTTMDRNGNIINQSVNSIGNNNINNMQNFNQNNNLQSSMNMFNMGMNNLFSSMNNMNNMFMNTMNNMNNMSNMMNNIFSNNMNFMNNMFGNNMNNMFGNNMMNMNNMNNNLLMNPMNNMNQGLDQNTINNLNITNINDVSKMKEDNKNCVICLEDFKNGDVVIYLPCLHVFHKDCLLEWFRGHDFCPLCKLKLTSQNIGM